MTFLPALADPALESFLLDFYLDTTRISEIIPRLLKLAMIDHAWNDKIAKLPMWHLLVEAYYNTTALCHCYCNGLTPPRHSHSPYFANLTYDGIAGRADADKAAGLALISQALSHCYHNKETLLVNYLPSPNGVPQPFFLLRPNEFMDK